MSHQLFIDGEADVDLARLPHEITKALDRETILVDQLTPGLMTRFEPGQVVVLSAEGQDLCRIPHHRLRAVSRELLEAATTEDETDDRAEVILAAIRAGRVESPPNGEYVCVQLPDALLRVHRCAVVPGWPDDDPPPSITRRYPR